MTATFREVVAETGTLSAEARGAPADMTALARKRVAVEAPAVWGPVVEVVLEAEAVVGGGERASFKEKK